MLKCSLKSDCGKGHFTCFWVGNPHPGNFLLCSLQTAALPRGRILPDDEIAHLNSPVTSPPPHVLVIDSRIFSRDYCRSKQCKGELLVIRSERLTRSVIFISCGFCLSSFSVIFLWLPHLHSFFHFSPFRCNTFDVPILINVK